MSKEELATLINEMRDEFQIPPYYDDNQLANLAKEGEFTVGKLNPGCSITEDLTYRMWNSLSPETQEMIIKCALLVAALGPVFSIISKVSGGISGVIDVGAKIAPVMSKAGTAFSGFSAILAANPIILVIAAVIALIAIFVTLYNKCEWFHKGVNSAFESIKKIYPYNSGADKRFFKFRLEASKNKITAF